MRLFATFAFATAAALTVSSYASAATCTRPAKLSIPDGHTASEEAMKATQAKLAPFAKEMSAYLHCLQDEVKSGKDEYDAVAADWTRQSEVFKNTPAPAK